MFGPTNIASQAAYSLEERIVHEERLQGYDASGSRRKRRALLIVPSPFGDDIYTRFFRRVRSLSWGCKRFAT
jgi:hypothetical protein